MTEKNEYYEAIRKQYPATISKDQFYRIAHISKATALYLLQSGLVPCKDTSKKTRRYTIRIDDVIFYMIDREEHPEVYAAPRNWYRERSGRYTLRKAVEKKLDKLSERDKKTCRQSRAGLLLWLIDIFTSIPMHKEIMLLIQIISCNNVLCKVLVACNVVVLLQ